jgi:hypothetical protein
VALREVLRHRRARPPHVCHQDLADAEQLGKFRSIGLQTSVRRDGVLAYTPAPPARRSAPVVAAMAC